MFSQFNSQQISISFEQQLCENARALLRYLFETSLMEWLIYVADVKMLVDIRSIMNDLQNFENQLIITILTCIL